MVYRQYRQWLYHPKLGITININDYINDYGSISHHYIDKNHYYRIYIK